MANVYPADRSSTSTLSTAAWLLPPDDSPNPREPAIERPLFHSRNTALTHLEKMDLNIRGYSEQEIQSALKILDDRKISPTHSSVSRFLESSNRIDKPAIQTTLNNAMAETMGVHAKSRLAKWLQDSVDSLQKKATKELNNHYASLWPDKQKILNIVDRWPDALKEQASYIRLHWPKLVVAGDMTFNFGSTTDVCSNYYGREKSPLGYQAFFRLVKDIWFNAIETENTGTINRVSHLLISFTKEISDNTYDHNGSNRKKRFESVIQRELQKGIASTYDIGALTFLLVTNPPLWREHKSETLKLMVSRAFNGQERKLAILYSQWQNQDQHAQISKTVESKVIPGVAMFMHYLHGIQDYLIQNKKRDSYFRRESEQKQIANGAYFDKVTQQLASAILTPEWQTSPPLIEIKETLSEFYANPKNQKLFLGTEEFKAYEKEQKRLKARQRFSDAIKITIKQNNAMKADFIKKQFKEQGFQSTRDVLGNISYGEAYYKQRKEYIHHLREQKLAVETRIGLPIPFKVTAKQLNVFLDKYDELPKAEQRYWKMSRAYAESTAIPELLTDLILTEESEVSDNLEDEHEKLQKLQSKFITCRCSECTVCEATRYLCECPDGLNQRIARKENKHRDGLLKQRIVKGVKAYFSKHYCTEGTPVPEDKKQAAIPIEQTQNTRKQKRAKPFDDSDKRTLSYSSVKRHFEHTLSDGSPCKKQHRPDSVIEKYQREFTNKVILAKVNDPKKKQRRHERIAEPVGQREYKKVMRQLYKTHADNASTRISDKEILEWFNKNPESKAAAISTLANQLPQQTKSLFKPETLELNTPTTFRAIPCQKIYHDIESFNKHLYALAIQKNNNFIPLKNRSVKGLYLHKTFCLACRTNFGQQRELKAHIETTHQANMKATFDRIHTIKPDPTEAPTLMTDPESFIQSMENPSQAFQLLPIDQQSQVITRFENESV